MKTGDRVGAICSASDDKMELFGYGVYLGNEPHPQIGIPNPKIQLDNGKFVWGCECWWGPEDIIKQKAQEYINAGRSVIEVDETVFDNKASEN